jgi:HPt (histidine-containing phosphotransfer) domain-containing protein
MNAIEMIQKLQAYKMELETLLDMDFGKVVLDDLEERLEEVEDLIGQIEDLLDEQEKLEVIIEDLHAEQRWGSLYWGIEDDLDGVNLQLQEAVSDAADLLETDI